VTGNLLEIRDLRIEFPSLERTVKAVRGADLEVAKGEVMGLVGESGSGKSMTALACLGLVPPPGRVTGSVQLDGHEVVGASEAENERLRGAVAAMIFQNPGKALNPFFTLGRQLTDAIARVRVIPRVEAEQAALAALTEVRIGDPKVALHKYPHQVSGGQLQRVMIAMALACRPQLVIADEPTTALDVTIQAQILDLLLSLQRERGMALILITHNMGVVAETARRVMVMYAGQVVEEQPAAKLFSAPRHPYTAALLSALPERAIGHNRLPTIPGVVPGLHDRPSGCLFNPRCRYADGRCRAEEPQLDQLNGAHVRCHYPIDASAHAGAAQ